jgi:outer membrane protein assembly factor BamB
MGRGAWLLLGCSTSVVVLAAGGYAVTRDGTFHCSDAVPDADITEAALPMHADSSGASEVIAQAAEEELGDRRGRSAPLTEDETLFIEHGIEALRNPPEGWSGPTSVLVDLDDPRLELVGDAVLADSELLGETRGVGQAGRRAYVVLDAANGSLRWARDQKGHSAGGAPIDTSWVLVQTDVGERPTVAVLDPTNGHLRSCTPVAAAGGDETGNLSAWPLGNDVAVAAGDGSAVQLSLVDAAGGDLVWEHQVEDLAKVGSLVATEDLVVVSAAANDPEARADAANAAAGGPASDTVHAVDPGSGSPVWSYQAEAGGGRGVSHSVVGASGDVVVVAADQQTEDVAATGQVVSTQLVGLGAADGQPRWTVDVPNAANGVAADVRLFGDVLVTVEADVDENGARVVDLVARSVDDGGELWRTPFRGTPLRDADLAGDTLLLPTNAQVGTGMDKIDLHTGEAESIFNGVYLARVDVDDDTVAVTAYLGAVASGILLLYDIGG